MPKYVAVWEQDGEGCDYTIGCGIRVDDLGEHPTIERAIGHMMRDYTGSEFYESYLKPRADKRLKSIEIHEVVRTHAIDLAKVTREEEQRRAAEQAAQQQDAERAEYERLKKKFGG